MVLEGKPPNPHSDEQPNKEHDDSTAQLGVDDSRRRIDKGFHKSGFHEGP